MHGLTQRLRTLLFGGILALSALGLGLSVHDPATRLRLKPDPTTRLRLKPDPMARLRLKPDPTTRLRLKPDPTARLRLKPDPMTIGQPAARGGAPAATAASNLTRGCVDRFDANTDYFPDKVVPEDARNFGVTYHRSYKTVAVRDSAGATDERYVLVQCGTPAPPLEGDLAGAQVVTVPVTSLYSSSTTHLSLLADLDRLDVLTGVSQMESLAGDAILARARTGKVREFAPSSVIDAELVASERPGLLMSGGTASAELALVRRAGVPVVSNVEWLETSALGRAEWIKYMALFLNEERAAQRVYGAIKARYQDLEARATAVPPERRPTVMTGVGARGEFVISGGRSYVAALIADAGGRYVWADDTSAGARTVDFEAQLARAAGADVWINGSGWSSLAAMVRDEPRYANFKSVRAGQVWVFDRALTEGGNDYWSRAVSRADLVLADLVKIFHPDLVPEHQFQWYSPVPQR